MSSFGWRAPIDVCVCLTLLIVAVPCRVASIDSPGRCFLLGMLPLRAPTPRVHLQELMDGLVAQHTALARLMAALQVRCVTPGYTS
jgi:hypothetical protein